MTPTIAYAELSDLELLDGWRAGDKQALDELIVRYNVPLQRYFGTRLVDPNACADLIQTTLEALLVALPRYKGRSSIRTYIFKIATYKLSEYLRGRYQRDKQDEFDSRRTTFAQIYGRSMSSILGVQKRSEQLRRLIETLSIDDQSMLLLCYWEDMSAREIGEVFEMTEDAVRAKLYRLREKLREKIRADDDAIMAQLRQARDDSPV